MLAISLSALVVPARADLGFLERAPRRHLASPSNGDRYQFRSNATYTFLAAPPNDAAASVSHSGFWKIVEPTDKNPAEAWKGQSQ
jgi:hypothetical protein